MKRSTFSADLFSRLPQQDRMQAIKEARKLQLLPIEDVRAVAAFWKVHALILERGLSTVREIAKELGAERQHLLDLSEKHSLVSKAALEIADNVIDGARGVLRTSSDAAATAKKARSDAGKKGAKAKHSLGEDLRVWAVAEAKQMTGLPTEKARQLMNRLPKELRSRLASAEDKLKDPERLIRDALSKERKQSRR